MKIIRGRDLLPYPRAGSLVLSSVSQLLHPILSSAKLLLSPHRAQGKGVSSPVCRPLLKRK